MMVMRGEMEDTKKEVQERKRREGEERRRENEDRKDNKKGKMNHGILEEKNKIKTSRSWKEWEMIREQIKKREGGREGGGRGNILLYK